MATDATGLLTSSTGTNTTQVEQLVQAYRNTRQKELDALTQKKTTLENSQGFFTTLNSKINSLDSILDTITANDSTTKFGAKIVSSSDEKVLTAKADNTALLSTNIIKVNRIATNDILISKRFDLTSEKMMGLTSMTNAFTLKVGDVTQDISFTLTGEENVEQTLSKITNAINSTTDVKVYASVVKDTSKTARLVLTAKDSGNDNKIVLSQQGDTDFLIKLGLDNVQGDTASRKTSSNTEAGYKQADPSVLDSVLEINGINVYRSSNTISDALNGVTLTLLKPQAADDLPITTTTSIDQKSVEAFIQPLLDNFNNILKYLTDQSTAMKGDASISSLKSSLRSIYTQEVTSTTAGSYKYLAEIGIKTNTDGTLYISDRTVLETALKDDPNKIAALFTAKDPNALPGETKISKQDGFAEKLRKTLSYLTGSNGLIKSRTISLSNQITSNISKTNTTQDRIDKAAESMRKQYTSMLKSYLTAQNQYSTMTTALQSTMN